MIIEKLFTEWTGLRSGHVYRQEWLPWEFHDHFPTDVPIVDLFEIDVDSDGACAFRCPCGEMLDFPQSLGEANDLAAAHVAAKHAGWKPLS